MLTVKAHITEYRFEESSKMHGVKRVLVFCIMIVILPASLVIIPLYLRRTIFADVTYPVAESDIIEIRDGISSVFCEKHTLHMSSNFNAFQLRSKPEISTNRKHIRLKKSMTLPDDTLEYWGFYLLKGAIVQLRFCSRYDGSRILVVKGQRNLRTCGLLDHNKNKLDANFAQGHEQVKVFFEDITEIASNFPATDLDANSKTERGTLNEEENNAAEDFNDNDIDTKTALPTPRERPKKEKRKKLKKGSANNIKHNASENLDKQTRKPDYQIRKKRNTFKGRIKTTTTNKYAERKQQIFNELYGNRNSRWKRNEHVYDRKYSHGGNAVNFTETDESNSVSSFESGLFECFNGAILLAEGFPPSSNCLSTRFLETGSHRMISKHDITEDGYYYYIFYSDNDLVRNDIHAIFDIYKPTFQYSNLSDAQGCINATNCTFSIAFLSDEIVVVEVPMRDGIEHEEDDITYLTSICHPRTEIYAIFPIAVLLLILSCSFL